DIETQFVEDRARGEVERVVAGVVAVARDERAARRQDLDLIRLVRADVKISLHVELDPIRTVQRTGSERRAVGEDRDRSSAAVFVDGDPQNAVVSGVGDVKETLRAIESNPVRAEGLVAAQVVDANVPGETGRIQKAIRRCGDPFWVVTARVVRVREVPNDALRGLRGEDGLPR